MAIYAGVSVNAQEKIDSAFVDTTIIETQKRVITVVKKEQYKKKERKLGLDYSQDFGFLYYLTSDLKTQLPSDYKLMELDNAFRGNMKLMIRGLDFSKNRLYFKTGIGWQSQTHRFKNTVNISTNNDSLVFIDAGDINYKSYNLNVSYIQVPLFLGVRLGDVDKNNWGIQMGINPGVKINSNVRSVFKLDGTKYTTTIKDDYNLNPFIADAELRVKLNWMSFYASYSLTRLYQKDKTIALYPLSFGISIFAF